MPSVKAKEPFMNIGRINKIIEVILEMKVGATLPIRDPEALPLLHQANNTKFLEGCAEITQTTVKKKFEPRLKKVLAPILE